MGHGGRGARIRVSAFASADATLHLSSQGDDADLCRAPSTSPVARTRGTVIAVTDLVKGYPDLDIGDCGFACDLSLADQAVAADALADGDGSLTLLIAGYRSQ